MLFCESSTSRNVVLEMFMKQRTHVLDSSWCLGSGASDLERLELAKIPLFNRELFGATPQRFRSAHLGVFDEKNTTLDLGPKILRPEKKMASDRKKL